MGISQDPKYSFEDLDLKTESAKTSYNLLYYVTFSDRTLCMQIGLGSDLCTESSLKNVKRYKHKNDNSKYLTYLHPLTNLFCHYLHIKLSHRAANCSKFRVDWPRGWQVPYGTVYAWSLNVFH